MYSNKNSKNKSTVKVKIIVILAVVVVLLLSLFLLERTGITNFYTSAPIQSSPEPEVNKINLNPPTEDEATAGDKKKESIIDEESNSTAQPDNQSSQNVSVIITDATQYSDQIEVRAFTPDIIMDGTCDFVFTKNNQRIVKESPAKADASSTPCTSISVNRSEFVESGTWSLEVTYRSGENIGSQTAEVEIR